MSWFSRRRNRAARSHGFTLLEVLVVLVILLIVLVLLGRFTDSIDLAWKTAATDPFAEAQDAFDSVVRHLASATLAPYQDYADNTGAFRGTTDFVPDHIARRSDLAFACGPSFGTGGLLANSGRITTGSAVFFVEPGGFTQTDVHAGLEHLLNAMGYFVEFGDDTTTPAFIVPLAHTYRWRLKEIRQPAEALGIFTAATSNAWIQPLVGPSATLSVLAENIVTLAILPERAAGDSGAALAPAFTYDSRDTTNRLTLHQLPPRVRIVLVAMDTPSAIRLANQNGSNAPQLVPPALFQQAAQLDTDLATMESSLSAQKINHHIFQREIILPGSCWSNIPSP